MKKTLLMLIAGTLLFCSNSFADDVAVDSSGNVTTGTSNPSDSSGTGKFDVTGSSGQHAIRGYSSGTGAGGIYGINTDSNAYGYLGHAAGGVYGNSGTGWAGYFDGDTYINGNLDITGSITGFTETDPVFSAWDMSTGISITESQISNLSHFTTGDETDPTVNALGKASLSCSGGQLAKWNGSEWACDDDTDTHLSEAAVDAYTSDNGYSISAFPQVPRSNALTSVDIPGITGSYTSMTVASDGLPVISYRDNNGLKAVKCGNDSCSSNNTVSTLDSSAGAIGFTSIAIGTDGFPVISYEATGGLMVAKCDTSVCAPPRFTITTVDVSGGMYNSITIGTDGLPVIAYYDGSDLKAAKCGNTSCSSGNTINTVDSTGNAGLYASIVTGTDGLPVISYYDDSSMSLKVAKCGDASCSSGNIITVVDSSYAVGMYTSITIGADRMPVISYYDSTNNSLKMAKCGNASCSTGNALVTVDSSGDAGLYSAITIGSNGLPLISYYDTLNDDLKIAMCGTITCSTGNSLITLDSSGNVGTFTSVSIGADSVPVISYYDESNADLKFAQCANAFCLNNWMRR